MFLVHSGSPANSHAWHGPAVTQLLPGLDCWVVNPLWAAWCLRGSAGYRSRRMPGSWQGSAGPLTPMDQSPFCREGSGPITAPSTARDLDPGSPFSLAAREPKALPAEPSLQCARTPVLAARSAWIRTRRLSWRERLHCCERSGMGPPEPAGLHAEFRPGFQTCRPVGRGGFALAPPVLSSAADFHSAWPRFGCEKETFGQEWKNAGPPPSN